MTTRAGNVRSFGNRWLASPVGLCLAAALACSPTKGVAEGADGTGGASSASGGAGGAGGTGAAGSGSVSAGGIGQETGGYLGIPQNAGGKGDTDASCAGLVLEPEAITIEEKIELKCTSNVPAPISIYLMLDNSGSMEDDNKWPDAVAAITAFVESNPNQAVKPWLCVDKDGKSVTPPASLAAPVGSGAVSVAIQYFHPQQVGGGTDGCNGSGHRTPAVTMGPIPANAAAITASLRDASPDGNTPTVGALRGGTQYCAEYQQSHGAEKCVVVLITDGQPNGCGLSSNCNGRDCVDPDAPAILTPIARDAYTASSSVVTFTVGMNGVSAEGFGLLNQIAASGGSDCTPGAAGNEACNVTTGGSQALVDALNTIRESVQVVSTSSETVTTTEKTTLQCEWLIPKPSDGQKFDKDQVNVAATTDGVKWSVGKVSSAGDCAATHGGWYYDDPAAPTKIVTCPETCGTIQASTSTKVEVQVGCATEVAIPK